MAKMNSLAINPWSGSPQLVYKINSNPIIKKEGECVLNKIHIAISDSTSKYILPTNSKESNWIKIFGKSDKGWILQIPEGQRVIFGMRVLDHNSYIHSNMHRFDFIHLIFLVDVWYIENRSQTIGISDV